MMQNNYVMEEVTFTKKSVESLAIANPRKLRKSQVSNLLSQLKAGEHFDSNLVANSKSGTALRIVDGHHRIETMKLYFEAFPEEKIKIWMATYKNLTPDEERKVYRKWNIPVKQSTDDFINSYKDEIKIFNTLCEEIPCSVYGSLSKLKMRDLINAHIGSFEKPYKGGEKRTMYDFVKYMKTLKEKDVPEIKDNFLILCEIFNSTDLKDFTKLSAFKNVVFRALYSLVANNKDELGDYLKRRMRTVLANRTILDQYRRYYGRRASIDAYAAFKNLLNSGQSVKKFV